MNWTDILSDVVAALPLAAPICIWLDTPWYATFGISYAAILLVQAAKKEGRDA